MRVVKCDGAGSGEWKRAGEGVTADARLEKEPARQGHALRVALNFSHHYSSTFTPHYSPLYTSHLTTRPFTPHTSLLAPLHLTRHYSPFHTSPTPTLDKIALLIRISIPMRHSNALSMSPK